MSRIHLANLRLSRKYAYDKFQIRRVPCKHMIAAITKARQHKETYMIRLYLMKSCRLIYWAPKLTNPIHRERSGRPEKAGHREKHESPRRGRQTTVYCGVCKVQ